MRILETNRPYDSGMGLPIAGAVVHASGGVLRLANQSRGGAEVTVELPAASAPEPSK